MTTYRLNSIDQALDVCGSLAQSAAMVLADEPLFLGKAISGQTGSTVTVASVTGGIATLTGVTGMTAASIGHFLTLSGAGTAANNGTFQITEYVSATSVKISNATAVAADANDGAIVWTERRPYSLADDLDFERTDRAAIKGVAYSAAIPTYTDQKGATVTANLNTLKGFTTNSQAIIVDKGFFNQTVASTNTLITLTSAGNLKHADASNKTGVPVFDAGPFTGNWRACYVSVLATATGENILVKGGAKVGEEIFGITQAGASSSPNSVEVKFYSVPVGGNVETSSTAYTWEATQVTAINVFYGFNKQLNDVAPEDLRNLEVLGIQSDGFLVSQISNIQSTIGTTSTDTSLAGLLTNTAANYSFANLPDGTPSVVEAFNTLNSQIGDRTYTGSTLTSGQTVAASLQALADAMAISVTRTIERVATLIPAGTAHTLPGAMTYTAGKMMVFVRKQLLDPGTIAAGDDYAETSSTQVTFYFDVKAGDHVSYVKH